MVPTFFLRRLPSVRKSSRTTLSMYSSSWKGRGRVGKEGEGRREERGREKEEGGEGDVVRQQKVVSHTAKFIPH